MAASLHVVCLLDEANDLLRKVDDRLLVWPAGEAVNRCHRLDVFSHPTGGGWGGGGTPLRGRVLEAASATVLGQAGLPVKRRAAAATATAIAKRQAASSARNWVAAGRMTWRSSTPGLAVGSSQLASRGPEERWKPSSLPASTVSLPPPLPPYPKRGRTELPLEGLQAEPQSSSWPWC